MATIKDFNKFLSNIEPSKSTVEYISSVQSNLRSYLKGHDKYRTVHNDTFLSGSYAKHTSIRPVKSDSKRDVDIIVVTNYDENTNSAVVLQELKDILKDKKTYDSAKIQSHSIGIELDRISIDVVPVIKHPKNDNLYLIGDSSVGDWTLTDPKGHISWSSDVNKNSNGKYKPIVKIFKWWRHINCEPDKKYPKGITLEKIIADNLGDVSLNTEDLLIETMQNILSAYKENYINRNANPIIDDPSTKVVGHDLLSSYTTYDFKAFILKLEEHLMLLNKNGTDNSTWRAILGDEFPKDDISNSSCSVNYYQCLNAAHKQNPIWPLQRGGAAFISVKVKNISGEIIDYQNNGAPLDKNCSLEFNAITGVKKPYTVYWQIVNTGYEAHAAGALRGNFEKSDNGSNKKIESTLYTGSHSVQCFIIRDEVCVARSKEFIVNIK